MKQIKSHPKVEQDLLRLPDHMQELIGKAIFRVANGNDLFVMRRTDGMSSVQVGDDREYWVRNGIYRTSKVEAQFVETDTNIIVLAVGYGRHCNNVSKSRRNILARYIK